ncbi:MAG: hypothetical protein RBS89_04725 [Candidatus Delongbacteria bacterium]|nr:hypothetical protein [Candidatus Delongbacteria bacterium]
MTKMSFSINKISNNCHYGRSRLILLLSFIILVSGCSSSKNVTLFYTGNYNGIIEGCNCPKEPEGNILNHFTFFRDSISQLANSRYICTGNIFSYNYGDRQNRIIIDIIDDLGYDYIAAGRNETGFYGKLDRNLTASVNINDVPAYKILGNKGLNVVVTSVTDQSYSKYVSGSEISEISVEEIYDLAESVKKEADIFIVVSNLESSLEKNIFNRVKAIDIMISNTNTKNEMIRFGDRLYLSHGSNAEYIGRLDISKTGEGIEFENVFEKITSAKFSEDTELKIYTDSLKLKYGIDKPEQSPDY